MMSYDPPIENPVQAEILELEDRITAQENLVDGFLKEVGINPDGLTFFGKAQEFANRIRALEAENLRLKERCASDPWWWAYSECLDDGWDGPYASREEAERAAADTVSDEDEPPEFSFRQASNPEGCAEIERLETELAAYKSLLAEAKKDSERLAVAKELESQLRGFLGICLMMAHQNDISAIRDLLNDAFCLEIVNGEPFATDRLARQGVDAARAAEEKAGG